MNNRWSLAMNNSTAQRIGDQKLNTKKPTMPSTQRLSFKLPPPLSRISLDSGSANGIMGDLSVPTQMGCSTIGAGGYRNKVALKPGHSALDWSRICTTKGREGKLVTGLDKYLNSPSVQTINHPNALMQLQRGVPTFMINPPLKIDKDELIKHKTVDDCWCVLKGKVYCLSAYFDFHPGGVEILLKNCAGRDATAMFNKYHRWVNFERLLEPCLVGVYVS